MSIKLRKMIKVETSTFANKRAVRIFCLLLWVSFWVLIPESVQAGVNYAQISCKSTSLKAAPLYLRGQIPGELTGFELTLKRNKAELIMSDQAEEIFVVDDFPRRVFSLVIKRPRAHLLLYAVPSSVLIKQNDEESLKVKFNAILLQAPNPEKDEFFDEVKMSCTYEYSNL